MFKIILWKRDVRGYFNILKLPQSLRDSPLEMGPWVNLNILNLLLPYSLQFRVNYVSLPLEGGGTEGDGGSFVETWWHRR